MMIEPPKQGEPLEELWRNNVELTKAVNLLLNMEVRVSDQQIERGRMLVTDGQAVLVLE